MEQSGRPTAPVARAAPGALTGPDTRVTPGAPTGSEAPAAPGAPGEPARDTSPWLLLMHQVPAKPDYLRVKVWRRLRRIGAVALKNAVWVLPRGQAALEDCHWLLKEIVADGGEALLCEASFLAGLTAAQREALARLRGLEEATRRPADAAVAEATSSPAEAAVVEATSSPASFRGRVWVTRAGVHVDRMASAWLIRGWIDPAARFRFAAGAQQTARAGELRFDTFEGEFTHEGDRCTFEVLAHRFVPGDRALARIGQLVHDVDCKDGKFGAPETAGFARAIEGICLRHPADPARLERGSALLDDLYAALAQDS